jgi:YD repeat-containing protein
MSVPTASGLPMSVQLVHNSFNASIDVGVGKGWMTNLHTCVEEDGQTGDITYMDATGAKYLFDYDSQTQTYTNPKGFAGKMTKEVDGSFTLQSLGHTKLTFGSNGKLTSIGETCGTLPDSVSITYDGNGNPTAMTDSLSNRSITLDYNGNGKLYQISDPLSNTWELSYNGSNQLIGLTQPEDTIQNPPPTPPSCSFSYDGNNLITGHDDFVGNTYTIGYEGSSPFKVTSWTDPASNQTTFAYAAAASPYDKKTTVTDAESIDIEYYFGATSGQVEKIQQSNGTDTLKIEMGYNGTTGFQTSSKDSYGNTTTISYDSVGHIDQITLPPSQQEQPSYVKTFTYSMPDSIDSVLEEIEETVTDQVDATTSYLYTDMDNPCLPTNIVDPLSQMSTLQYNSHGQITSLTQPTTGGTKTTSFSYHATTHDLSVQTDALGNETQYLRNLNGMVSEVKMYEGTIGSGVLKSDVTTLLNAVSMSLGTSDSVSGLTTALSYNDNGATTSTESELGCENAISYTDAASAVMASGVDLKAPSKGSVDSIQPPLIPAPTLPFNPYQPLPATSTNTQGETTTYVYYDNGAPYTVTNHLGQTTQWQYDSFGRTSSISDPFGKSTSFQYNLNSQMTSKSISGEGTFTYVYDNARRLTQMTQPMQGTNTLSRNLRGDLVSDTYASYSRDLIGRLLSKTFYAGGSETYSYSPEGYLTNDNGIQYTFDAIGNVTSKNGTSITYTGAGGSTVLGLPSSSSNQTYTYAANHFLSSLTDTSKNPSQSFQYQYSSSKELINLAHPNQVEMQQVFVNKQITSQQVVHVPTQTTLSQINQTFNANQQLTQYQYTTATGGTPFTESYAMTYAGNNNKLNTVTYGSNNQVLSYGYTQTGKLSTLQVSGVGTYTYGYNPTDGSISTLTYPNQSQETYSYNGPQNRLSQIQYPNNDTVTVNWNGEKEVQSVTYTTSSTTDQYAFQYDGDGRVTRYILTQNGIQSYQWEFGYDGLGIRTATKTVNGQTTVSHVFTTDTTGRPVSTTYQDSSCQTNCFTGEAYMHWDPCGSLTSMTDTSGSLVASFEYDKAYSRKINEHNPYGIEIPFQFDGRDGTMTATYGDASPQALVLQVHSSSRISIGNLAPILAPKVLCCYINGHGEEATCPANGGPEEECEDGEGDCEDCDELLQEIGRMASDKNIDCKEFAKALQNYKDADCSEITDLGFLQSRLCSRISECQNALKDMDDNHRGCLSWYWIFIPSCHRISDEDQRCFLGAGLENSQKWLNTLKDGSFFGC